MGRIALLILSINFLKQITIGSGFNIIKYFKNKKEYWEKYIEWTDKIP